MEKSIPHLNKFLLFLIVAVFVVSPAFAAQKTVDEWTPYFNIVPGAQYGIDTSHYNTSTQLQDQVAPNTTPWELWIGSGLLGIGLLLLSILLTLRTGIGIPETERGIVLAVMSWVPIGFCANASFAVDRIAGYGVTGQIFNSTTLAGATFNNHEYVYMENHLIYTEPIVGILMLVCLFFAVGYTLYLISTHKALRGNVLNEDNHD
jgi:hypothetical protein